MNSFPQIQLGIHLLISGLVMLKETGVNLENFPNKFSQKQIHQILSIEVNICGKKFQEILHKLSICLLTIIYVSELSNEVKLSKQLETIIQTQTQLVNTFYDKI